MDLRQPKAASPQVGGTGNLPARRARPNVADTLSSGQSGALAVNTAEVPEEVMLADEPIAAANALTGDGEGLSRTMVDIAAVAGADSVGCPRLRSARGTAAIAWAIMSGTPASAPINPGKL